MTPDELVPAPESPTPAPEAPPESRPEAAAEAPPTLDRSLFERMLDQTSRHAPPTDDAEAPGDAPPAPRPRPEAPAPAAPAGRYAGRFDTPEALETGYKELERLRQHAEGERGRAQEQAQRLERLLVAALQGQRPDEGAAPHAREAAPPRRPAPAPDLAEAVTILRQEHERLGLADPEGDPVKFARALAVVLASDDLARQAYIGPALRELQRETAERTQLEQLRSDFFTQYPDLRQVRLDRLRDLAVETEAQLRQTQPELSGEAFIKQWFDTTAREARATFRTDPGGPAAPAPAGRAGGVRARPETPRATGAPFAESPSPRASEPALTGQAYHLARVFGRGPQ